MTTPTFCYTDVQKFDKIVGLAITNSTVCNRLLSHDISLVQEFDLPDRIWMAIQIIKADSLIDFCKQFKSLKRSDLQ